MVKHFLRIVLVELHGFDLIGNHELVFDIEDEFTEDAFDMFDNLFWSVSKWMTGYFDLCFLRR